jgi:hypothetical protein
VRPGATERAIERAADALAAGPDAKAQAEMKRHSEARSHQGAVVAALERRCGQAEAAVREAEAALAQAEATERQRQAVDASEEFLDRARKADAAIVAAVAELEQLRAAAAAVVTARGPGRFSTSWDAITIRSRIGPRVGRLVAWLIERPRDTWAEMGAAIADPRWVADLAAEGLGAAYPEPAPPEPEPASPPFEPMVPRRPSRVVLPPPERPERAIGASTMDFG